MPAIKLTRDYIALIIEPDGYIRDIYAAANMRTLTRIVCAVRLPGDTVQYTREQVRA